MNESGQDLFLEVMGKMKLLDQALYQINSRGRDYAQAESDYRQALAQKNAVGAGQGHAGEHIVGYLPRFSRDRRQEDATRHRRGGL